MVITRGVHGVSRGSLVRSRMRRSPVRARAIKVVLACLLTLVCLAVPASAKNRPAPRLAGTTCVDGTGNDATSDVNGNFPDLAKVTLTARGGKLHIEWTTTDPVVSDPRAWGVLIFNPLGTGAYQIKLTVKGGVVSQAVDDLADYNAKQRTTVDPYSFDGPTATLVVPFKALPKLGARAAWQADVSAGYGSDVDICSSPDGALLPSRN